MTEAEKERAAIVEWLRGHSWECEKQAHRCKADMAHQFANEFSGLAVNYAALAQAVANGDHHK